MPQASSESPPGTAGRVAAQIDAETAGLIRPPLARADIAAAVRLAEALRLAPSQADRLASAVRGARRSPAVAASLLGLAPDEEIARAAAALYGAPLWEGPPDDVATPAGLNARFLAENHAMVL